MILIIDQAVSIVNIDNFFIFAYSKKYFAKNEPRFVLKLSLIFGLIWGSLSS